MTTAIFQREPRIMPFCETRQHFAPTDCSAVCEEGGITYTLRSGDPHRPNCMSFGAKWKGDNGAQYGFWFCVPLINVCDAVSIADYRGSLREMATERRAHINSMIASGTLTDGESATGEVPAPTR